MRLVENKKLGLHVTVIEKVEAGIELYGFEVKSLRAKLGSLEGAKVIIRGGEAFLVGAYIPSYQPKNTKADYENTRMRKLLLHKKEIDFLVKKEESQNLTIHPISLYTKNSLVKCEVGLCKKLQKYDKRETIKKEIARREEKSRK